MSIFVALVALVIRFGTSQSAATASAALNRSVVSSKVVLVGASTSRSAFLALILGRLLHIIVPTLLVPVSFLGNRFLSIGIGIVPLVVVLLITLITSLVALLRTSLIDSIFSLWVVSTLLTVVSIALVCAFIIGRLLSILSVVRVGVSLLSRALDGL
jgi:hypothetical protein